MARTATSTPPLPQPRQRVSPDQSETVAAVWLSLSELWLLGKRHARAVDSLKRLQGQLEDPALRDHPIRPDAVKRLPRMIARVDAIEVEARTFREELEGHYRMLTETNRRQLVSGEGWSPLKDPELFAAAMWLRARTERGWPHGETGF